MHVGRALSHLYINISEQIVIARRCLTRIQTHVCTIDAKSRRKQGTRKLGAVPADGLDGGLLYKRHGTSPALWGRLVAGESPTCVRGGRVFLGVNTFIHACMFVRRRIDRSTDKQTDR